MSKHPVVRQSSTVYMRRRLVVGLGLLVVLVVIILIIVRPGSSSGETGGAGKAPAASSSATHAPKDAAKDAPKDAASTTIPEETVAVDGAACSPKNVQVEAITDASRYEPGVLPELSLSVTNTGAKSCVINAGTAKQVFTVTSGKDTYWSSSDCQTDAVDTEVTLKPGVPVSSATPVEWDRTRSAKDTCDSPDRQAAPAAGASYYLNVSVDGIKSTSPKQLLLY